MTKTTEKYAKPNLSNISNKIILIKICFHFKVSFVKMNKYVQETVDLFTITKEILKQKLFCTPNVFFVNFD